MKSMKKQTSTFHTKYGHKEIQPFIGLSFLIHIQKTDHQYKGGEIKLLY